MSSPPDTVAPEQLTEEERAFCVRLFAHQLSPDARFVTAKLLRVHDQQRERIGELALLAGAVRTDCDTYYARWQNAERRIESGRGALELLRHAIRMLDACGAHPRSLPLLKAQAKALGIDLDTP